jgi:hypothetical protein
MPRSTALTHFSPARSLEPYRTAFRLLTMQVEGIPPMQARPKCWSSLRRHSLDHSAASSRTRRGSRL